MKNKIDTYVLMAVLGIISILSAIPLAPYRKSLHIYLDDYLQINHLFKIQESFEQQENTYILLLQNQKCKSSDGLIYHRTVSHVARVGVEN